MSERSRIWSAILRWLVAAAVGAVVTGTSYFCAYLTLRNGWMYGAGGDYVRRELDELEKLVEKYRQTTGRLPAGLADLGDVKSESPFRLDDTGRIVDRWKNPYQSRVEGEMFTLYSFGRDGLPGGAGLDADIYPTSAGRRLEPPTIGQFTFDMGTKQVQYTCLLAGIFAGLVCLFPTWRHRSRGAFWVRMVATAVGAFLTAVVICFLFIGSGH
jgi:hypothetical protein